MKNIKWELPSYKGTISNGSIEIPGVTPKPNDNFTATYKGVSIRLCTIDSSDSESILARVLCPDSITNDSLPDGIAEGETVTISNAFISYVHLK